MAKNIKLTGFLILLLALFWSNDAKAVSISPPVMEVEIAPGSFIERTIEIGNETDRERAYSIGVKKFEMVGEEGHQKFISIEKESDFGLTSWIKYKEAGIIIPPKTSRRFEFIIDVPQNADPGGHYASIYFSTGQPAKAGDEDSGVGVEAQIHSLILVRVLGNVVEKAEIESFGLEGNKTFLNHLPALFVLRVKNQGSVHIRPKGNIEIKNILGKRAELLDANPKNFRVLPGSVRKIESPWGKSFDAASENNSAGRFIQEVKNEFRNFAIGKYSAKLDIVYGKGNANLLSKEVSFWIIPWRILLTGILGLIILLLVLRFAIKKYNQWIINKAKVSQS